MPLIFKAFMDDEILDLADSMARHLPARMHLNCKTVQAAAYAITGRTDDQALYVALVSLDTGRWPGTKVHEERLPEYYPELPEIAERLGLSVGDTYQIALARAVWYVVKHPVMDSIRSAARLLRKSTHTLFRWKERGYLPPSWHASPAPKGHMFLWPRAVMEGTAEWDWVESKTKRVQYFKRLEEIARAGKAKKYEEGDNV